MLVLVIGSGGREHALAWRLACDSDVDKVVVAPGNAGISGPKITLDDACDIASWLELSSRLKPALTVVGPEGPLVGGIVDSFEKDGFAILGPCRRAAKIEGSKIFAKAMMERAGIPTASWQSASTQGEVLTFTSKHPGPYAVKADGLAGGKGVERAETAFEASAIARSFFAGWHGEASRQLVIESWLDGVECSLFALCDGTRVKPLLACRDYKRLADGDQGQNTGSMGAYCPMDIDVANLSEQVFTPLISTLAEDGIAYRGFLYAGLMIDREGKPSVLEYNCRPGDPELQAQLMLWKGPIAKTLLAAATGSLGQKEIEWRAGHAVCVVMAAKGYPDCPEIGWPVEIPESSSNQRVFSSGVGLGPDGLVAASGRVLGLAGTGENLALACERAYELSGRAMTDNAVMRNDIASPPSHSCEKTC